MGFGVVIDHKLRKAVGVGIFQNQQLALAGAGDHGGGLVGIQECSVLVFSAEIFPLVNAVRHIIAALTVCVSVL